MLNTQQQPVAGQDITLSYDLWSRITRRSHAGSSVQFAYDVRGLLSELINENNATSRFAWDVMDRLVQETGVDGRIQHYHYNSLGQLTSQDDGQGSHRHSIAYHYDEKGNLVLRRWGTDSSVDADTSSDLPEHLRPLANPAFEQRFTWDEQHRLRQAQHYRGHGETALLESECRFDYNSAGQLATETQQLWHTHDPLTPPELLHEYHLEHQQDILGHRIQSRLPDVGELGILRYGAGHVQGIALNRHSLLDIHRDRLHREVERHWHTETNDSITRQQHWSPMGRLHQRIYQGLPVHLSPTTAPDHTMAHTQGQGIDLLLNLQHRHYHYDALGQLTHIQQPRQMQR